MSFFTFIYLYIQAMFFLCLLVDKTARERIEEKYMFLKIVDLGPMSISTLVGTNFILIGTFLPKEIIYQALPFLESVKVTGGDLDFKTLMYIIAYSLILFMYFLIKMHLRSFKVTKQ